MLLGADPSPAGSTVNIRYISPEPMLITVEAVNSLGVRIPLGKRELHKDLGDVQFDISTLPAGAYRLVGHSALFGTRDLPLLVVP
jgi:hypothetical protein